MAQSADNLGQPVGQGDYTVKQGDCISSIACGTGHLWQTIWNHAANADLKQKRGDPNVLLPGDQLTIPPLQTRDVSGASDKLHKFQRKGVPENLRIVVRRWGDPLPDQAYVLIVDGKPLKGQTDEEGRLEQKIPPDAQQAILKVGSGDDEVEYHIDLGALDPIDSISGIQGRLLNLGFYLGELDGQLNDQTLEAIGSFCSENEVDLPTDGQISGEFRQKLKSVYGF